MVYLDEDLEPEDACELRVNMLRLMERRKHLALYEQDHDIPKGPREIIIEPNPTYL